MKINSPFGFARWFSIIFFALMFVLLHLGGLNIYLSIAGSVFAALVVSFLFRILALIVEKSGYGDHIDFFF